MFCSQCKKEMEYVDLETDSLADDPYYYCNGCDRVVFVADLPDDHPDKRR